MSGNVYMDIIQAQQRQGNLGGKRETESERKKREKKEEKQRNVTRTSVKDTFNIEFEVTIDSGVVYEAQDSNGLSDTYVVISSIKSDGSLKQVYRSSVCKKTLSPVWNENGTMKIKNDITSLKIELYDQDLIGRNDFIGSNTVKLGSLIQYGGSDNHDIEVYKENEGKNTLTGKVKFSYRKTKNSSYSASCV